jgi:hypothetical protein
MDWQAEELKEEPQPVEADDVGGERGLFFLWYMMLSTGIVAAFVHAVMILLARIRGEVLSPPEMLGPVRVTCCVVLCSALAVGGFVMLC